MASAARSPGPLLSAILACILLVASCSDDPVRPSGPRVATEYTPSLEFNIYSANDIAGRSITEVYATNQMLLRYDGSTWHPMELPAHVDRFRGLWITADGAVNIWGDEPFGPYHLYRLRGGEWDSVQLPTDYSRVWVAPNGEIFSLTVFQNRLRRYDGSAWSTDSLAAPMSISDVTGSAANDVYAVGDHGMIAHFDGSSWNASSVDSAVDFRSAWKTEISPLYLASYNTGLLYSYDGAVLDTVDLAPTFRVSDIIGAAGSGVFVTGYQSSSNCGFLILLRDAQWSVLRCEEQSDAECAWGDATGVVLAGYEDGVWRIDGGTSSRVLGMEDPYSNAFAGIWGTPGDGIFVVGSGAHRFYDGRWTDLKKEELTNIPAHSVSGTSARDLWAVGSQMILHYDGASWVWMAGAGQLELTDVWAGQAEALAVGGHGVVLRYNGEQWQAVSSPVDEDLFAVWGWGDGALAAGDGGVVLRYDGTAWRRTQTPITWSIYDLFGLGPDRIYAVGSDPSQVAVFDGRRWTFMDTGAGSTNDGNRSRAIWASSTGNLFVAQYDGTVLHYDGREWARLPRVIGSVRSIWGASGHDLFVTTGDAVLRYTR